MIVPEAHSGPPEVLPGDAPTDGKDHLWGEGIRQGMDSLEGVSTPDSQPWLPIGITGEFF